jgi:hypothetical protein
MHYQHRITIEATTAEEAARELCGYHITPSSYSHLLTQCDMSHVEALAADMRERGWKGSPVLVTDCGADQPYLINGRHRCVAACLAGIPIEMWEISWDQYLAAEEEGLEGEDMQDLIPRDAWIK